jgi:ribosomal protein S18 acetylase RimI-like enzyme
LASLREFRFPDDYPAVVDLWSRSGPGVQVRRSDSADEIAKKLKRDPDLFLVAEEDNQLVGVVFAGFDGRRGMIYHLAIDHSYRRKGIARMMMAELERRLAAKGCIRSYLLIVKENHEAIRFYEDNGWEAMDLLIYGKDLDQNEPG